MISNLKETKWRQLYQNEDELDSDEDPDDFAAYHELNQSKWITDILKNEPTDKVYIRREDSRCGGFFNKPLQLVKSFQKQRIYGTKMQYKYHEAEMMDIDKVRPHITLVPTDVLYRKREYTQWLEKYYQTTTMYFQFSRIIFEKSDGDCMYSVYQSNGHVFQVVTTPPIRTITDLVNDEMPGPYGMSLLGVEQHGTAHREILRNEVYETTQLRVSFRKPKFVRRQFMVITSNLQTFEGIVLKKVNGDFEYLNGLITYSDGRIEQVS